MWGCEEEEADPVVSDLNQASSFTVIQGAAITCLAVFQEQKVQEGGTYKTPAFQEVHE